MTGLLLVAPGCDNSTNDVGNGPKSGAAAAGGGTGPATQADAYKQSLEAKPQKPAAKDAAKDAVKAAPKDAPKDAAPVK